jgi:Cu2+-exporting ATPase
MKKAILSISILLFLLAGGMTLSSCNGNSSKSNKTKTEVSKKETAEYQCPMKCEGDKTYDKPGKCPVCGMNLKEVAMADGHDHEGHTH